ncbi:leucyl/phenylalanyl-tRNA--protein transferase [Arsukibacterium sp.]|uniref:leucyl/phenylalanyl-tRNA--protein transferase n=1 Tax=Arsukibacterium sp. TaxID=1977258 RepID=UPI002FD98B54
MALTLPVLESELWFPPVNQALTEPDGLLAFGGDLSLPRLQLAYYSGIFPWFSRGDPLLWWSPSIRALFAPGQLQLNRTLNKQLRRDSLTFSINKAFQQVVLNCAAPRPAQPDTWILPPMQQAYYQLHQAGLAHSIEVWQQQALIGGLYGVLVGGVFCGESMFYKKPNAAKFALVLLQQHLASYAPGWIDCQMPNDFLMQMGATTLPREEYLSLLQQQRKLQPPTAHWQQQTLQLSC